jgi:hypothetical protein
MATKLVHATQPRLRLVHPMSSAFISHWLSWPTNVYIKTPEAFPRGGSGQTQNYETEAIPANIGGGNTTGIAPVASPTSPTSPTPPSWWRGSSPPLDYGFVAVACSISLLCYDVTWLWHILCNFYVVNPYLLDDQWDVILHYVLDVWVDAYCYPVIYYLFWSK